VSEPDPTESADEPAWLSARATYRKRHPVDIGGEDLGRIVALSDGVFAFALTLLVLSLAVPVVKSNGALGSALNHDFGPLYGYAFAFVMIAIWWIIHNRTYQYIARFDTTLVWINMALLAQIAIMPFVLTVYTTYTNGTAYQYAVVLFAAIQITLGVTNSALWEYARRAHLTKPTATAEVSRYFARRGYVSVGVFGLSIALSFWNVSAAELSWVLLFVLTRFLAASGETSAGPTSDALMGADRPAGVRPEESTPTDPGSSRP
jgi:uncharacterized membrane protein